MARRRAHAGLETEALQVGRHMRGGLLALRCIGRIGRHRLDAQQRKQAIEACLKIAVDAFEDLGKSLRCRHGITSFMRAGAPGGSSFCFIISILHQFHVPHRQTVACLQRSETLLGSWCGKSAASACHVPGKRPIWRKPAESAGMAWGNGRTHRTACRRPRDRSCDRRNGGRHYPGLPGRRKDRPTKCNRYWPSSPEPKP